MISITAQFASIVRSFLAASSILVIALALTLPMMSNAAMYAYVNTDGDVRMVTADDPMTAILTAPGRALRSGVMLLRSATDAILGDEVRGV